MACGQTTDNLAPTASPNPSQGFTEHSDGQIWGDLRDRRAAVPHAEVERLRLPQRPGLDATNLMQVEHWIRRSATLRLTCSVALAASAAG